jgi:hypothetical protein
MSRVTLSAVPEGNGFQATVALASGVSVGSTEVFPTKPEAISAAACKFLVTPELLEGRNALDNAEWPSEWA